MQIASECNRRTAVQDFRELNAKAFFITYILTVVVCLAAVVGIQLVCRWFVFNDETRLMPSDFILLIFIPGIVGVWFWGALAFNGWLDRRANNRATVPADAMPLKTRLWYKLTGGVVADSEDIPLKQMFWLVICRRYRVIGMPRYWIIEDILYVWAWKGWMQVKIDYANLPSSYDVVVMTADVLGWLSKVLIYGGKMLALAHDWIIHKRIAQLKAEYYRKFGEEI